MEYCLVDIIPTSGTRNCNTYLIAKLSKESTLNIFIGFAIKAFGDGRVIKVNYGFIVILQMRVNINTTKKK